MDYCPRCKKYVNVRTQAVRTKDHTHTSSYCETCGMTIATVSKKHPLNNDHKKKNK